MFRKIYIILFLIILLGSINAQDRYESFPTWLKSVPEYGFDGMKNSITEKSNLMILGTVGIGTLLAYQFDEQINKYTQQNSLLPYRVSQFGDLYGVMGSALLLPISIIITSKT